MTSQQSKTQSELDLNHVQRQLPIKPEHSGSSNMSQLKLLVNTVTPIPVNLVLRFNNTSLSFFLFFTSSIRIGRPLLHTPKIYIQFQ